jgi:hypothetical protein
VSLHRTAAAHDVVSGGRACDGCYSIEELLHQDEVDGPNDALRRNLNALTEEQWQYHFKVERKQPDIELAGQLIVRESEERPHVLYIWVAAMVASFGMMIGAIQASHYLSCRQLCKTIIATANTSHIPPSPPVDVMASGGLLGWWRRRQKVA